MANHDPVETLRVVVESAAKPAPVKSAPLTTDELVKTVTSVIEISTQILVFLLVLMVVGALLMNFRLVLEKISQISAFSFGMLSVDFGAVNANMDASVAKFRQNLVKTAGGAGSDIDDDERENLTRRLKYSGRIVDGKRILWVDDRPGNNDSERHFLETLGARVSFATTNEGALDLLLRFPGAYSLILSDIGRPDGEEDGMKILDRLEVHEISIPVIFYITNMSNAGVDRRAFGLTNRPTELMHLILDALARKIRKR